MHNERIKETLWSERWPAPAKLNLMLRITGRREDGYHLLQTVFQYVDLCDWITFYPNGSGKVQLLNAIPDVAEQDNLIVRAANLLKVATGCALGVEIAVEKNLPMGGGLGGGSSDAATTLVVLNALWELNLSKEKLLALGLTLGADVPAFVFGHASWGEGVGEKLCEIDLSEQWVVIIKPDCHVETKEIFCANELTRNSKSIRMPDFMEGQHQNDCLEVVCNRYPQVKSAMQRLAEFSEARLTGTGSCVYALFSSYQTAKNAYNVLKKECVCFLVKGLNKSPLYEKLEGYLNIEN